MIRICYAEFFSKLHSILIHLNFSCKLSISIIYLRSMKGKCVEKINIIVIVRNSAYNIIRFPTAIKTREL